jgi:dGTP triphosphohydrolase
MKANAIHRGLIHLMVTGVIVGSGQTLERWVETRGVRSAADFRDLEEGAVGGREIDLPPATRKMLAQIEAFLDARVRSGQSADRVDGRGRRVITGLFAAYHADPRLLEDHLLLRYKQECGRRFLRDLPRDGIEAEIERYYRPDPRFVRLLADHLASMTDTFALDEHHRLMEMGAIPIPGAEQLRRERNQET